METNVNYTVVGAFVIILTTALILGIIWLSSGFSFERYSTYMVYMQESVSGLSTDSPVEYNGVTVGEVKTIELNRKNPQLVELTLDIKSTTPITRGTVAMLTTRGITGITYIALKDKSTDLRPLVREDGDRYPVIKTAPSIFVRLEAVISDFTANFHKISDSIQTLLSDENQTSIRVSLANLEKITSNLAANNKKFNSILLNTEKVSQDLGPLIQSGRGTMKALETQTLPEFYRAINNLNSMSRTLNELSVEIKQNPSVLIRGVDRQELGPGESK